MQINLPAFENKKKKYTAWIVSVKTVRMVKSRPGKNQSERSDLPCYIIILFIYLLLFIYLFFATDSDLGNGLLNIQIMQ